MDAALQKRVQRYGWDKAATHYENFWQSQLKPSQDLVIQMIALQAGEHVLDIACGTGLVSFRAADLVGPEGYVLGTDISEKMIESCNQTAQEKNYRHVKFERMDAEELDIQDAAFDVAICSLGLMYVPDSLRSLQEMNRVLKPEGRIAVSVWGQRDHCGWAEIFPIVEKRVSSDVCPMFFNLGVQNALQHLLAATGFLNIQLERLNTLLQYKTADDACGAAFAGGPVALPYFKFDDKVKQEAHAEYLRSIEKFKRGNGYAVPGEFVVGVGYKM